jgi:hypothetical protein
MFENKPETWVGAGVNKTAGRQLTIADLDD